MAERTIDAQRASAPVPRLMCFFVCSSDVFFFASFFFSKKKKLTTKEKKNFLKKINQKIEKNRDTAQLYAQLADAGLQYGPAFRLLRNVHVPEEAMKSPSTAE